MYCRRDGWRRGGYHGGALPAFTVLYAEALAVISPGS